MHSSVCAAAPRFSGARRGHTVVELLMTIAIVSVLAATLGMFVVNLLTFQEKDREEAYIRERLSDICGEYADFLSIASSVWTRRNINSNTMDVKVGYRGETGGVSLETGRVSRVAYFNSAINRTNRTVELSVDVLVPEQENPVRQYSRSECPTPPLIVMKGDQIDMIESLECTIAPIGVDISRKQLTTGPKNEFPGFQYVDTALWNLELSARYKVKDDRGVIVTRTATVERMVRLWNRE